MSVFLLPIIETLLRSTSKKVLGHKNMAIKRKILYFLGKNKPKRFSGLYSNRELDIFKIL